MKNHKYKYTYDRWHYSKNCDMRGGGTGGTNLRGIRKNHNLFVKNYPQDIHLILSQKLLFLQ